MYVYVRMCALSIYIHVYARMFALSIYIYIYLRSLLSGSSNGNICIHDVEKHEFNNRYYAYDYDNDLGIYNIYQLRCLLLYIHIYLHFYASCLK